MSVKTLAEAFEQARMLDAPLGERLAAYARSVRELNFQFAEAVDRLVRRLQDGGAVSGAPKVGETMPSFVLPDHTGRLVALDDLLGTGPVAITFARGHWCPYCQIALSALADVADEMAAIGAQAVVIVPDRQKHAARLRNDTRAPFPILCDVDNGYALTLGLTFWIGEELQPLMRAREADPVPSQGNDSWFVPVPATFIVGTDGFVRAQHVDPDYRKRMEIDEMLASLRQAAPR